MFKWLVLIVVIGLALNSVLSSNREAGLQSSRNREQGVLLARIEQLNTKAISSFVDDWRSAYPEPSAEKISELQVIEQRLKNNPSLASQYTKAAKQESADKFNAVFSSPLSGDVKPTGPGI